MPKYTVVIDRFVTSYAEEKIDAPNEESLNKLILERLPHLKFRTEKISIEVRDIAEEDEA